MFVVKSLAQNVLEEAAHVRLGSQVSGIIGFGTNRVPSKPGEFCGSYEDSFIGQFFLQMPQLTNYTFGMALESPIIVPQQDSNATTGLSSASMIGSTAGILHLIQPDSSYYNADKISWTTTNVSAGTNGSTVPPSDWTVVLDGWVASTKSNQVSSKGKIVANLDPLYTGMYVPQNQAAVIRKFFSSLCHKHANATAIDASIPGAALQKGLSTLGNLSMAYTIPCDARFTFGIVVDSQTFFVDQSNLIVSMGNGKCASSIEAWADPSQVQYVFGSRLMSTIYLYVRHDSKCSYAKRTSRIFTVPRDGSQQIGFSPRASGTSPLDVKSIVGGTVGGAALLALSIFAGLYFRKHWRSTQPRSAVPILPSASEHEEPAKTAQTGWHIRPFTMMSPTSSQPLSPHTPLRTATSVSYPMSALSIGRSPSPPLSPVIVIEDDRSINVAPPSYRGHESYLASLPINSPGVIQASQSSGGASDYTARATCGSKEPL